MVHFEKILISDWRLVVQPETLLLCGLSCAVGEVVAKVRAQCWHLQNKAESLIKHNNLAKGKAVPWIYKKQKTNIMKEFFYGL